MTTTEYEGRTVAVLLQLELIAVVQKMKETGARKKERQKGNVCEGDQVILNEFAMW